MKKNKFANEPNKGYTAMKNKYDFSIASKRREKAKQAVAEACKKEFDEIRFNLGKVIESVQYVEYNIAISYQYSIINNSLNAIISSGKKVTKDNVIEITKKAAQLREKLATATLGQLMVTVASVNVLAQNDLDELEDILTTRNKLVHQFFKVNNFEEQSNNPTFLKDQKNYLIKFNNRITSFNSKLYNMIEGTKKKISNINVLE